jgi:hypothetical protein
MACGGEDMSDSGTHQAAAQNADRELGRHANQPAV